MRGSSQFGGASGFLVHLTFKDMTIVFSSVKRSDSGSEESIHESMSGSTFKGTRPILWARTSSCKTEVLLKK